MRAITNLGLASSIALGACTCPVAASETLRFAPVHAPAEDGDKRRIIASPEITLEGRSHAIGFHTILRSGDLAGSGIYGLLTDRSGRSLRGPDGSARISQRNDFASLIPVGSKIFMVSQFEDVPGAMYLTALAQDKQTGLLKALSTRPIDVSGVHGGRLHCAGSVTPWNGHLGSEEYEPDAREPNADLASMADYFSGDPDQLNPYDYGWALEVKVLDEAGRTEVIKHYAMGRRSLELAYVMPDRRTVYLTDDGTNVGLFMFIADQPGDLSAGTLYAARWVQKDDHQIPRVEHPGAPPGFVPNPRGSDGGAGALRWVGLGHAAADEIRRQIRNGIDFADIFEVEEPAGEACPQGFRSINTGHGSPFHECLKLRDDMEKAASRLESRRYAAYQGATTEWRKMEGLTHDPEGGRLFLAMSEIALGMEDHMDRGKPSSSFDRGGPNHIRLPHNLCGAVYAMRLAGGVEDTAGAPIASPYVAIDMVSALAGRMTRAWDQDSDLPAYPADGPFAANKCDLNGIANPDNLTFIPGQGILIIGEDTGEGHQNDALWAYDLDRRSLTRILTTPYGSEVTSPYFYQDVGGFAYLISVVQHPFGESDQDKLIPGSGDDRAYTGYLGPFPAMSR
jgi:hypothetical protein